MMLEIQKEKREREEEELKNMKRETEVWKYINKKRDAKKWQENRIEKEEKTFYGTVGRGRVGRRAEERFGRERWSDRRRNGGD